MAPNPVHKPKKGRPFKRPKHLGNNLSDSEEDLDDGKDQDNSLSVRQISIAERRRIKKDALYKPLLRRFRNYLRKELDAYGLLKGCHYWNSDRMRQKIWLFMNNFKFPPQFMT